MEPILYLHILSACAWIGGSILLFGLGVFLKDKALQERVYSAIGPFYGYFETVWLVVLIVTGYLLAKEYALFELMGQEGELSRYLRTKAVLVSALSMATMIHLYIAFATHRSQRSRIQHLLSRGGSLAIFILNLWILWMAMMIRSAL